MSKYDDKGKEKKAKSTKGYISATINDLYKPPIQQQFKGEVVDVKVRFPKDLGTEHPFNFEDVEKTYSNIGVVNGGVNKMTDSIVGDFSLKSENKKAMEIIDDFIKHTNFGTVSREWIKEGVGKGNGFMEIDLKQKKVKVNNANTMYVKRTRKAVVKGYNQWIGKSFKGYTRTSSRLISFNPNQIAHLKINKVAGAAYGLGIVYPNERIIENMVLNEEDLHKLISRKAGAPIHVTVGVEGESTDPDDVDDFKEKLQYMTNSTEWVTDANVKMAILEFGEIGKNLTDTMNHDMELLAFGMEIPIVIWGAGNIPEGLAKVQLEVLQRKIRAIQEEIEGIIQEQIFRPLLEEAGIKEDVEFVWNLPGEEEINKRLEKLIALLSGQMLSDPMRKMIELEIARLLKFEEADKVLLKPEKDKGVKDEADKFAKKQKEEEIKKKSKEETEEKGNVRISEFVKFKEGEYSDYLVKALKKLKADKFEELKLPQAEVIKLRLIFKEGFRKNQTINQIGKNIKDNIKLKELDLKSEIIRLMGADNGKNTKQAKE